MTDVKKTIMQQRHVCAKNKKPVRLLIFFGETGMLRTIYGNYPLDTGKFSVNFL